MTADKVSTERLAELILIGERAANPDEDYQSVLAALRELQSLRLKLAEVERALQPVRDGTHVIVPREPTERMIEAGIHAAYESDRDQSIEGIYRAMLAASKGTPHIGSDRYQNESASKEDGNG